MLQDIMPKKLDNHYSVDVQPEPDSIFFHFRGLDVLVKETGSTFPVYESFISEHPVYLFSIGDVKYFLARDTSISVPEGYTYKNIKSLRSSGNVSKENFFALFTAYHLSEWYGSNCFCGRCGQRTEIYQAERAVRCTGCGKLVYPRLNPAVIVGVVSGEKLLITHYVQNRGVTCNALVAGFTEIGETFEETVSREVMEEVGLKVKNIRYYKSQPWGFSGCILAGFFCEVDGDDNITLDASELSSAVWTEKKNISGQTDDYSLTNEMMMYFKNS
ncbi:MAG: NAD(+) diphosphatase [Muribaculaceae bacterium]|nr:NAD(+) diphosphatase [Alistipes senegalensis]MCM1474338.1 NAD(+) diphosphatase [Muribaculaceae bacterium]